MPSRDYTSGESVLNLHSATIMEKVIHLEKEDNSVVVSCMCLFFLCVLLNAINSDDMAKQQILHLM